MSQWASAKARVVLRALLRKGWTVVSQRGSHIKLSHPERGNYMFGFHENEEIGPKMLAKIAKHTGLEPDDL
ncbi:MAG: type II toxin-antitoxin system HicA family toxin [Terriglobales bacterium]